eukprot:2393599-Pyramimonas_sp.AAC.1
MRRACPDAVSFLFTTSTPSTLGHARGPRWAPRGRTEKKPSSRHNSAFPRNHTRRSRANAACCTVRIY